jgi:hypothetical protein
MSHETRCPNCGCAFELSPEDLAAIVEAIKASAPPAPDGPKSSRFAFRPVLVEQDRVQVVRIEPTSAARPNPSSR